MRRSQWLMLLPALWLLPAAACAVPTPSGAPDVAMAPEGKPGSTKPAPQVETTAGTPGAPATAAATAGPSPTTDPAVIELIQNFKLPSKGPEDALVTIYEFSDYLCPYCRQFATETAGEVDKAYVDTGKVRFIHWDFPLTSHGWPAIVSADAAHCAGEQGQYWAMYDTLFGNWRQLADLGIDDEAAAMTGVLEVASKAGDVDQARLKTCVEAKKYRPVLGVLLRQATDDFKIRATPSLAIVTQDPTGGDNNHIQLIEGFYAFEDLKVIIDQEISRALGTPIPDQTATPGASPVPTP